MGASVPLSLSGLHMHVFSHFLALPFSLEDVICRCLGVVLPLRMFHLTVHPIYIFSGRVMSTPAHLLPSLIERCRVHYLLFMFRSSATWSPWAGGVICG